MGMCEIGYATRPKESNMLVNQPKIPLRRGGVGATLDAPRKPGHPLKAPKQSYATLRRKSTYHGVDQVDEVNPCY